MPGTCDTASRVWGGPHQVAIGRRHYARDRGVESALLEGAAMAIYDRPVRILLREMIDQLAPTPDAVFTRQDALN